MRLRIVLPVVVLVLIAAGYALSYRPAPEKIAYGMSFSVSYAEELGLNWKDAYRAMLDDLGVKRLRLPAYWPMVEPKKDAYEWSELDFEVREARTHNATIILAVGKRLPRWPECHVPEWASALSQDEQKAELRAYIRAVIERYKNESAVTMWQVENEPYLRVFAEDQCGNLDESFLKEEISLVHALDPSRPILVTDSGNLGLWTGAYRQGDVFGTSVYLYFWNPTLGAFRTVLPPSYYRVKANVMRLLFGARPVIVSELSLEPWFGASVGDVSLGEQLSRMNIKKFDEILSYARETNFDTQYLWGVEWWYYMKTKGGHPEFWDAGQKLFSGK
jgi:hypothetical protein